MQGATSECGPSNRVLMFSKILRLLVHNRAFLWKQNVVMKFTTWQVDGRGRVWGRFGTTNKGKSKGAGPGVGF